MADKPKAKEPRDRHEGFDPVTGYSFRRASSTDKERCKSFARFINRFKALNEHNDLGPLARVVEDALAAFIVEASKAPGSKAAPPDPGDVDPHLKEAAKLLGTGG